MKAVYKTGFTLILLAVAYPGAAETGLAIPGIDASNARW